MTTQQAEPATYRDASIGLLAGKLYAAHMQSTFHDAEVSLEGNSQLIVEAWWRVAEAAVDELIDRPEREFQARLAEILASEPEETPVAKEWRQAAADDWLPEHA